MNEIYVGGSVSGGTVVGYSFKFTDTDLRSLSMITDLSLIEDELAEDQFIFTANYKYYVAELFAPRDFDAMLTANDELFATSASATADYQVVPYATAVYYYADGNLMGKFYLTQIIRSTKTIYETHCVSAVGLMDTRLHYGGVYDGVVSNVKVSDVIASILDENGSPMVPYTVDPRLTQEYAYGYLPVATKRENLHQLLFGYAISLIKDADGSLRFVYLDDTTITNVPDSRIFAGGNVEIGDIATAVEVTEHNYRALSTDEEITLFDNTNGSAPSVTDTLVYFQDPVHDLRAEGLTVSDSGANWATVTGTGTLYGKRYTHTTQVLRKEISTPAVGENVKSVTDATMVTPLNSANVVNRLAAYYSARKTVHMDMVVQSEKAGDQISFTNPYGNEDAGYLVQLDTKVSSFAKTRATIITGYQAQGFGNYYTDYAFLTGSGTWTSPVTGHIRVQMFGGGTGGGGGSNGVDGSSGSNVGTTFYYGEGGNGGGGGNGGAGGNAMTVELDVTEGQTISYACGTGGAGGAVGGGTGQAGTDTTFGSYSTQGSSPSPLGITNPFTGITYCAYGATGTAGASGGKGGIEGSASPPVRGGNVGQWVGGASGGRLYVPDGGLSTDSTTYYGGGGGGAAYGANGANAEAVDRNTYNLAGRGAVGGNGAIPTVGNYGSGGNGGNGGGGGGGGAFYSRYIRNSGTYWYTAIGGTGGLGSAGANGGDGGILIYMNTQA